MKGARLYGRTRGFSSYAQVTRGFAQALAFHQRLAGTWPIDDEPDLDEPLPPGASAQHGIYTGPPPNVVQLTHNTKHERRWGMLAPNSNLVPRVIIDQYEQHCTDLLAPSAWAAEVLRSLSKRPVTVAPHGVSPEFAPAPERRAPLLAELGRGEFRVLHLSTSDRERKGTLPLVRAWRSAQGAGYLPREATLTLLLDAAAAGVLLDQFADEGISPGLGVKLMHRLGGGSGGAPEQMAELYGSYHLVCQPSRGEAFGLTPLEARACGVPILATACTGHAEHLAGAGPDDGVVIVEAGADAPIDDLPEAVGPALDDMAIEAGLIIALDRWAELSTNALGKSAAVRQRWAWENQLAPLMRQLEE